MLDSRVLETAIGVIFLLLGFSLITTAIQEFLASALRLRARALESGLKAMLTDGQRGLEFYRTLVRHPLIAPAGEAPSYVSASQFSTSVVQLLTGMGQIPATVPSLRIAVQSMPEGRHKTALLSIFREGEATLEGFEQRLQTWFDDGMDRLSGVYKRLSQYVSFAIGLVLAVVFQADAIGIGAALWNEPALRTGVSSAANSVAHQDGTSSLSTVMPYLKDFHFSPIWENHFVFHWTGAIGCLLTGFAVTLGAPFWFDMLQSFVNLRGTGPAPKKARKSNSTRANT